MEAEADADADTERETEGEGEALPSLSYALPLRGLGMEVGSAGEGVNGGVGLATDTVPDAADMDGVEPRRGSGVDKGAISCHGEGRRADASAPDRAAERPIPGKLD